MPPCPPCKLLLNSGGLTGALQGILDVKDHLDAEGKQFHPDLIKKLNKVICGAHDDLVALEPDVMDTANHVSK